MEKPLYILDLEGTTGIYSTSSHNNDTIQLRPGFKELLAKNRAGEIQIAIATRAPLYFVEEIQENMRRLGHPIDCKIYTKEDLQLADYRLLAYKDYEQVYQDYEITNLESQTIILGDFLRFPNLKNYLEEDFKDFDFTTNPEVLTENNSLNDHPFPDKTSTNLALTSTKTPIYTVLPQPWTTQTTLDLTYVMDYLEKLYKKGNNNFKKGLEEVVSNKEVQKVESNELAQKLLRIDNPQDYLIIKGNKRNWSSLERLM